MSVEEIPADELVVMTSFWHKAFNAAGCDPMCHCCEKMISVNDTFKLSTVLKCTQNWGYAAYFQKEVLLGNKKPVMKDYLAFNNETIRPEYKDYDTKEAKRNASQFAPESHEVMLCETCDPDVFMEKQINELDKEIERIEKPKGGCFRINGKIVH